MADYVLRTPELVRKVASYQVGWPFELVPLAVFLDHALPTEVYGPMAGVAPEDDRRRRAFAPIHALFPAWFERYGVDGLGRLLQHRASYRDHLVFYAVLYGNVPLLEFLSTHVRLDVRSPHWCYAAYFDHLDVLEFLMAHGYEGYSTRVFSVAVAAGHLGIVRYLHELGSLADSDAMRLACEHNHLDIAEYLHYHLDLSWDRPCVVVYDNESDGRCAIRDFLIEHGYVFETVQCPRRGVLDRWRLRKRSSRDLRLLRVVESTDDNLIQRAVNLAAAHGLSHIVTYFCRHRVATFQTAQALDVAKDCQERVLVPILKDQVKKETPRRRRHPWCFIQ
ncbi:hypothetical protein SPRG_04838 [Saprolegnia parasitica CBS 223.65]|uniref:Uncharacterized protein n=1 Tax=Saprolegnia parasitica (strain CBS 223.65) TaxID=695850 RepID=A0A067CGX6_SAPPC|nr:hypothetical protein SPRG_04838 [Saprolegnia parasitica CBS 223.65]KDO29723.1 hypothetical protein SPRG_04838 [Saprolegnia parasitica CBS 223.65]|eukprot:XP_012199373.1 hypothetical protein SPRG_04838 [Saprolegnia parasitica CBS 223.65]